MHTDPQMTLNQLNATDMRVLSLVDYLSNLRGKLSVSGARYTFCSQRWLAQTLGVTRETINRSVAKLVGLGVLRVTHRRKVAGHFQTNLMVILRWTGWGAARVLNTVRRLAYHVSKSAPKVSLLREAIIKDSGPRPSEEERGRLTALLSDLAARFAPKPS